MGFISGAAMVAIKAVSLHRVVATAEGFLFDAKKSLCLAVKLSQAGVKQKQASPWCCFVCSRF